MRWNARRSPCPPGLAAFSAVKTQVPRMNIGPPGGCSQLSMTNAAITASPALAPALIQNGGGQGETIGTGVNSRCIGSSGIESSSSPAFSICARMSSSPER